MKHPGWHLLSYPPNDKIDQPRFWKSQHLPHCSDDDDTNIGAGNDFLDDMRKILENNDCLCAGVLQLVLQLWSRIEGIGVYNNQSRAQRAQHRNGILKNVRQHDCKAIALLHRRFVLEPGGEVLRLLIEFSK